MSQGIATASPPASRISAVTRSQSSAVRLEIVTLAPCAARAWAMARPMPFVAPVTTATFPVRSNKFRMMAPVGRLPLLGPEDSPKDRSITKVTASIRLPSESRMKAA